MTINDRLGLGLGLLLALQYSALLLSGLYCIPGMQIKSENILRETLENDTFKIKIKNKMSIKQHTGYNPESPALKYI